MGGCSSKSTTAATTTAPPSSSVVRAIPDQAAAPPPPINNKASSPQLEVVEVQEDHKKQDGSKQKEEEKDSCTDHPQSPTLWQETKESLSTLDKAKEQEQEAPKSSPPRQSFVQDAKTDRQSYTLMEGSDSSSTNDDSYQWSSNHDKKVDNDNDAFDYEDKASQMPEAALQRLAKEDTSHFLLESQHNREEPVGLADIQEEETEHDDEASAATTAPSIQQQDDAASVHSSATSSSSKQSTSLLPRMESLTNILHLATAASAINDKEAEQDMNDPLLLLDQEEEENTNPASVEARRQRPTLLEHCPPDLVRVAVQFQKRLATGDPWARIHLSPHIDGQLQQMLVSHPSLATLNYDELSAFGYSIPPLCALIALHASLETLQACLEGDSSVLHHHLDVWVGTPLHYACSYKAPVAIVEWLLGQTQKQGVRLLQTPNASGRLPLHTSLVFGGAETVVSLLLQQYPQACETPDTKGCFALHVALEHHASLSIIQELVELAPSTLTAVTHRDQTPLHVACAVQSSLDVLQYLVGKYNENDNNKQVFLALDEGGNTPLAVLCKSPPQATTLQAIQLLVRAYPPAVPQRNDEGQTPLDIVLRHYSQHAGAQEIMDYLQEQQEDKQVFGG